MKFLNLLNKIKDTDVYHNSKSVHEKINEINTRIDNSVDGVVLYENSSGTEVNSNSYITLSDEVENYDCIEVYYAKYTTDGYNCNKIYTNFSNKRMNLIIHCKLEGVAGVQILAETIGLSTNKLTYIKGQYLNVYGSNNISFGDSTQIKIFKVIGYK